MQTLRHVAGRAQTKEKFSKQTRFKISEQNSVLSIIQLKYEDELLLVVHTHSFYSTECYQNPAFTCCAAFVILYTIVVHCNILMIYLECSASANLG